MYHIGNVQLTECKWVTDHHHHHHHHHLWHDSPLWAVAFLRSLPQFLRFTAIALQLRCPIDGMSMSVLSALLLQGLPRVLFPLGRPADSDILSFLKNCNESSLAFDFGKITEKHFHQCLLIWTGNVGYENPMQIIFLREEMFAVGGSLHSCIFGYPDDAAGARCLAVCAAVSDVMCFVGSIPILIIQIRST
jgi:hypothetical protein